MIRTLPPPLGIAAFFFAFFVSAMLSSSGSNFLFCGKEARDLELQAG
jgi:hypothetical protein